MDVQLESPVLMKRLAPGDDLKKVLDELPKTDNISSGVLLSVVGSLRKAGLRFANASGATELNGPFEIVSGTGTVGSAGIHVHLSLSDSKGATFGGHMMPGCIVYTTIELAILDLSKQWSFTRDHDAASGFPELNPVRIWKDLD